MRTAFGYVRIDDADDERINRLHDLIADHATREGMELGEVYTDRNTPSVQLVRPGLEALLESLARSDRCVVLVPSEDHVSRSPEVRRAIEQKIVTLGGAVATVAAPVRASLHQWRVFHFPPTPTAARDARSATHRTLRRWGVDGTPTETAQLIVSELVTNAVKFSPTRPEEENFVTLALGVLGTRLLVEVWDADQQSTPIARRQGDPAAENGRGLFIVESLAAAWAFYRPQYGGKVVWAEIRLPATSDAGPEKPSDAEELPRRTITHGPAFPCVYVDDLDLLRRIVDRLRETNWAEPRNVRSESERPGWFATDRTGNVA